MAARKNHNGHIHPPGEFCGSNCPKHSTASVDKICHMIDEAIKPLFIGANIPMWSWWRPLAESIIKEVNSAT